MAPKRRISARSHRVVYLVFFSLFGGESREDMVAFLRYARLKREEKRNMHRAVDMELTVPCSEKREKENERRRKRSRKVPSS